jgi:single-stranded DNA-specific DHH superfamily exonuclease
MNKVLGTEDSSNPPLICEANAPQLLTINNTTQSDGNRLTPEITPAPSITNDDATSEASFNTGKKIKGKDVSQSEALVDLLIKNYEFEEEHKQEKEEREVNEEQRAMRQEMRVEKLVNMLETLVQHLTKE